MSRRTEFASSWWAQRWIRVLEKFGWSARLNRGRSYARHGNVLDLDVQSGLVRAKVQGSRKQPYRVEIGLKPLSRQDWNKVFSLLRRKAIYAARLLSGEMPRDIEEIFKAAEVPLFPQSGEDLIMSCTCPDWASPCKHLAAVYYVLGSEFDREPFLLFELRGRSREQVMAALRGTRPERMPGSRAPRVQSEPLADHINDFWEAGEELDEITIRVTPPLVPQSILKRLGPVPLRDLPDEWHGDLARMYEVVSKDALAFVNLSGKITRVPILNQPEVNGNGSPTPEDQPESENAEAQWSEGQDGEALGDEGSPEDLAAFPVAVEESTGEHTEEAAAYPGTQDSQVTS
jgi:uncharacterized Zn finger protein